VGQDRQIVGTAAPVDSALVLRQGARRPFPTLARESNRRRRAVWNSTVEQVDKWGSGV
jgi:hypothetical protein